MPSLIASLHAVFLAAALSLTPTSPSLTPTSPSPSGSQAVRAVVHGPSWAVVHADALWVCWRSGPDCWRRIELEPFESPEPNDEDEQGPSPTPPRVSELRLAFSRGGSLWIAHDEGPAWRLEPGHGRARLDAHTGLAPAALERPQVRRCSSSGQVPVVHEGTLSWTQAPRCEPRVTFACSAQSDEPLPSRRRMGAAGLRLRAGIELTHGQSWSLPRVERGAAPRLRQAEALTVLGVVEFAFDPARARAQARNAAALRRRHETAVPSLQAVPGDPLSQAHARALAAIACRGGAS